MMSPEERQITICLTINNLEQIENLLKARVSSLPDLEEENQQQFRKTLGALQKVRSVNAEINLLKLENGRLTAKRVALQQEYDKISNMMQKIHQENIQLAESVTQEDQKSLLEMNRYEAKLGAITKEFRENGFVYNEEIVRAKTETANKILSTLSNEEKARQKEITELSEEVNSKKADVPENILDITGRRELNMYLNILTAQYEKIRRLNF